MTVLTVETDIELRIRQAAMKVFLEKGHSATSMKAIADEAGIKRTLLHYYFRNKEKLYDVVFSQVMRQVNERTSAINRSGLPIGERIEAFIDDYFEGSADGDHCEAFFLHEYNQNPEHMKQALSRDGFFSAVAEFIEALDAAHARGELGYNSRQLFLDILSLCMFPFSGQRMLADTLGLSEAEYAALLLERKTHVKKLLKNGLRG